MYLIVDANEFDNMTITATLETEKDVLEYAQDFYTMHFLENDYNDEYEDKELTWDEALEMLDTCDFPVFEPKDFVYKKDRNILYYIKSLINKLIERITSKCRKK
jgi:hypothetical protein